MRARFLWKFACRPKTKGIMESEIKLLKPFIEGLKVVLKTMCETDAEAGKPFIRSTEAIPPIDIASYIALAGTKLTGAIVLKFPAKTYLGLVSKMLGEEFTELNSEISDGAAEILNQLYGHGKTILNQLGYDLDRSLPKVLRGENLEVTLFAPNSVVVLPVKTTVGMMYVEFYLN